MSTRSDISRTMRPVAPQHIGVNLSRIEDWRSRLIEAAGKLTYRQIADRTGGGGTKRLSHTTVRSVLVGETAGVQIDTLAAICDALAIDMAQVIGGPASVFAVLPPGAKMLGSPRVRVVPVVALPLAHKWKELTVHVDPKEDLLFLDGGADGVMAARVMDDSMSPRLQKGDVVTFARDEPSAGDMVLVEPEDQGHTLVRTWRPVKDQTKIKLEAENAGYGAITMSVSKLRVVGVITGLHRHLT